MTTIEQSGKRDWVVSRDGVYLGVITEMEAVEGAPFYVTSIEHHAAPAHKTFDSAVALFDAI